MNKIFLRIKSQNFAILLILLMITALVSAITPFASSRDDLASSDNSSVVLPTLNETISNTAFPFIANSSKITINNGDGALPNNKENRINITVTPQSHPHRMLQSDGSLKIQDGSTDWTNHWWKTHWYGTWNPYSAMTASFKAEANTIGGLSSGDVVMYLPINVMYGSSFYDAIWFQFEIAFFSGGATPVMTIWDIKGQDYYSTDVPTNTVPYIAGHNYNVGVVPYEEWGTNYVMFYIQDTNTGSYWTKNDWHWPVGGLTIIVDQGYFSPASCVEGYTTNNQLTNVPYLQSYVGETLQGVNYWELGPQPSGFNTATAGGPNYYYWKMDSSQYVASISSTSTYGYGSVDNAWGLTGSGADGNYAWIWGGNYGDGGNIVGAMNTVAGGTIVVVAHSNPGYYSNMLVYTSYDGYSWTLVGQKTVTNFPTIYVIGTVNYGFKYVAVVGYDQGNSVALNVDMLGV